MFLSLLSLIYLPYINSVVELHNLSISQPGSLPPGQLDLVLSHPPGQVLLSHGCHSTELVLRCPARRVLVTVAAQFIPAMHHTRLNCSHNTLHSQAGTGLVITDTGTDISQALNRRCSGYSSGEECRFSLLLDLPQSLAWGEGWVKVWHRCVDQDKITTRCGTVRQVEPGYIMSRAYPKYYKGGERCTWHISVPAHQVLVVIVMDLQVECGDTLTIDYDTVLCGEIGRHVHYVSPSNSATLVFSTRHHSVYPYRGILVQIVPVGCTPVLPSNHAYLVHHNKTHATYHCIPHYVFHTTLSHSINLLCTGHTYHIPLPHCVSVTTLNTSIVTTLLTTHHKQHHILHKELFLPIFLTILTLIISISGLIILFFMRNHLITNNNQPLIQPTSYHYPHTSQGPALYTDSDSYRS